MCSSTYQSACGSFAGFVRSRVSGRSGCLISEPLARGGEPKYSLRALVFLAVNGLIGFSSYPLRLVTSLGLATICLAMILLT